MSRSITVKGIGKLSLKPDQTVISLTLRSFDKIYDKSMDDAAEHLDRLRAALVGVGFAKDDLKTEEKRRGLPGFIRRTAPFFWQHFFVRIL